jgi:hypothetical protein
MSTTCIQRCVRLGTEAYVSWKPLDGAPFPSPDLLPWENVLSPSPTRLRVLLKLERESAGVAVAAQRASHACLSSNRMTGKNTRQRIFFKKNTYMLSQD